MSKKGISIIIPTYNERWNMSGLLKRLFNICTQNFKNYEILVIDDDSSDGTYEEVKGFKNRRLKIFVRTKERGLASAIKFGVKKSKFENVCVMDADFLHRPEDVPKMFTKINAGADIVIGSRFVKKSELKGVGFRIVSSRIALYLLKILFPKLFRINDSLAGFFMMRKEILKNIDIKAIGFKFLLEILIKCRYAKVVEIPSTFMNRVNGKSKLTWMEYIRFGLLIFHLMNFQIKRFASSLL